MCFQRYHEGEILEEKITLSVPPSVQNKELIDFGLNVEHLIILANKATQELIMVFFSSSIASLTVMCFLIVADLGLSNATHEYSGKHLLITCHSLVAVLYLIRVYSIMASGQQLSVKVKQARRVLDDVIMKENTAFIENKEESDMVYVLRKRLEVYQYLSPIAPYAVFNLSIKTFCTTLATVITYIVVLIKLQGVETSKATTKVIEANSTAHI